MKILLGIVLTIGLLLTALFTSWYGFASVYRGYAGYCTYEKVEYYHVVYSIQAAVLLLVWIPFVVTHLLRHKSLNTNTVKALSILQVLNISFLTALIIQYPRMIFSLFFFDPNFSVNDQTMGLDFNPMFVVSLICLGSISLFLYLTKRVNSSRFRRMIFRISTLFIILDIIILVFNFSYRMCQG